MRFARPLLVGLIVLLMAVTPLNALISPGRFELRIPGNGFIRQHTVILSDQTGLVQGFTTIARPADTRDSVTNPGRNLRVLVVRLEGGSCDFLTELTFRRDADGFVLDRLTNEGSCAIGVGTTRYFAIFLWAPIDATTVRPSLGNQL